jgi:hypothetical protein
MEVRMSDVVDGMLRWVVWFALPRQETMEVRMSDVVDGML